MSETALAVIIIANWNGRAYLERCLEAIFNQCGTHYHVVVVDNGSTDGSEEWIAQHYPQVETIALPNNAGFAVANNIGIAATSSRYVVTLNNDTEVDPNWLEALIDAAESDPSIGTCAPLVLLDSKPSIIDSAGIEVGRLGFAWQRGRGEPAAGKYQSACDVFGPSAAAALYRRTMLERIGLFDEDFESYYEDVDLAWRAQRIGWQCRYVPEARVMHIHSATGDRDPERKYRLLTRNRWWTIVMNYPTPRLWFMLPFIVAADMVSLFRGLVKYRSGLPVRARVEALQGLPRVWAKRRLIQRLRHQEVYTRMP